MDNPSMSRTMGMQLELCSPELAYEHDETNKEVTNLQASNSVANVDHADQYEDQQQDAILPTTECETSKQESDTSSDLSGMQSDPQECGPVDEANNNSEKACTQFDSNTSLNEHTQKEQNKKLYLETVEEWRPGKSKIVCPVCGFKGQPLLRRHRGQAYKSALGIICTFGCCPVQLLPFMLCLNRIVKLHCSQCKYYLGTYDRKKCRLIQRSSALGPSAHTSQS